MQRPRISKLGIKSGIVRSIDFRTRVNEGRLLAELEGFVSFRPTIRNSDNRDNFSKAGTVTPRALNPALKPQMET